MQEIKNILIIDSSGQPGAPGIDGANGFSGGYGGGPGSRGSDGNPGNMGQNANNINLTMTSNEGEQKVFFHGEQLAQDKFVVLGNPDFLLNLRALGGNGGKGGSGGRGGDGGRGTSGSNATSVSSGTNGGSGGSGGGGGNGASGGPAGNGGNIILQISEYDSDLLMYMNQCYFQGGKGGIGGALGSGGSGGSGGPGGSSYTGHRTKYNADGTTSTESYTNSGGSSGMPGMPGMSGHSGPDGPDGIDGTFQIQVTDTQQQYATRYNLSVIHADRLISDDGIIEPGEHLSIPQIKFQNYGDMPTPKYQDIVFYLENNKWVYYNHDANQLVMKQQLHNLQEYTIERPLQLSINQNHIPAVNSTFQDTIVVDYRASVQRVNKQFPTVSEQIDKFVVRYPVEISQIQFAKSIMFKEEAPFTIGLKNISTQDIGLQSQFKQRLLRLRLNQNNGSKQIKFFPKHHNFNIIQDYLQNQEQDNLQQFIVPIEILRPGEIYYFSGTLKFSDPYLQSYTKSEVKVELDLGHIDNMDSEYQTIQIRTAEIQLAEIYEHKPSSQFLLITNGDISKEVIEQWRQFAEQFGSTIDVWNLSNYGGFQFSHLNDTYNTQFYNLLKDKIVIFFNNEFEDNKGKVSTSIEGIGEQEIYKTAHFYGIASCIISYNEQDINFNNHCFPYSNYYKTQECINTPEAIYYQKQQSAILQQKREIFSSQNFDPKRQDSVLPPELIAQFAQNQNLDNVQNINEQNLIQESVKSQYPINQSENQNLINSDAQQNLRINVNIESKNTSMCSENYSTKQPLISDIDVETMKQTRDKFSDTYQPKKDELQFQADETFQQIQISNYVKSLVCCQNYSESLFQQECYKLHQKLEECIPNKQFLIVYDYKPIIQQSGFLNKKCSLGSLQIREGLPKNRSYICHRQKKYFKINEFNHKDMFAVIKLMKFEKKLENLSKIKDNVFLQSIFFKAIVSDLVDETVAFFSSTLPIIYLSKKLTNWNLFKIFKVDKKCSIEMRKIMLQYLTNIRAYLRRNFSNLCCKNRVSDLSKFIDQILYEKISTQFNTSVQQQESEISRLLIKFAKYPQDKLQKDLQLPYSNILFNNNLENQKVIFSKNDLPYLQPSTQKIQEAQFKFFDTGSGQVKLEQRIQKIEEFEQQIQFES